jgi:hypothetical protein
MTTHIKSVSVSEEMEKLTKQYNISPSEAYRVGLSVILSDLGDAQYLNKLNIGRKLGSLIKIIQEMQQKIDKLEGTSTNVVQVN